MQGQYIDITTKVSDYRKTDSATLIPYAIDIDLRTIRAVDRGEESGIEQDDRSSCLCHAKGCCSGDAGS